MTRQFRKWWKLFKKTGRLDPVRLGCSREDLEGWFGPPDDTETKIRQDPTLIIWLYGEVEFHFNEDGELVGLRRARG